METYLIYVLKSAGIIALFAAFYLLFLRKETFFNHNRIFLLVGLLISLMIPLITIENIILVKQKILQEEVLMQIRQPQIW